MKKMVGIRGLHTLLVEDLKRDLLFFDKLYIVGLKELKFEVYEKLPYKKVRTFKDFTILYYS